MTGVAELDNVCEALGLELAEEDMEVTADVLCVAVACHVCIHVCMMCSCVWTKSIFSFTYVSPHPSARPSPHPSTRPSPLPLPTPGLLYDRGLHMRAGRGDSEQRGSYHLLRISVHGGKCCACV